jgi:hypothetical protein
MITRTQTALSHPHIGAKLRGLLWYQGETDAMDESLARDYHKKLSQLFQAFREKLGQLHVSNNVYFESLDRFFSFFQIYHAPLCHFSFFL